MTPTPRIFRLRHLLGVLLLGGLVWQLVPRAEAAWTLRERATQFADYAACMAGPTGPIAARDRPEEFAELIRRRLLTSEPEQTPFAECAKLSRALTSSPEVESAHRRPAGRFVEYGSAPRAEAGPGEPSWDGLVSLAQLHISTEILADLARAAWPLERQGYTRLVRPSSHAKEAPHPVEFPTPGVGSGLPAWRTPYRAAWSHEDRWLLAHGHGANLAAFESRDQGRSWRATTLGQPGFAEQAGRCAAAGSRNAFTFESAEGGLLVHSWLAEQPQRRVRLSGELGLLAASCDEETALLAFTNDTQRRWLVACRHAGACGQVPVEAGWLKGTFDLARVGGVNVIATIDQGIVRVRSSRDDGVTWTPATVAFDAASFDASGFDTRFEAPVPTRLLTLGRRLLLHGGAKSGGRYPLLVSDDFGASWRGAPSDPDARRPRAPADAVSQR